MIDFLARAQTWARLLKNLFWFEGGGRDRLARVCLEVLVSRSMSREFLSLLYLRGAGIEIGALHQPLPHARDVRVRYVDRFPEAELRRHYPELKGHRLVPIDILDDGERLGLLQDGSQDFVIANNYIEHCEDPLGAIFHMVRVLRPGGILYLSIPDKRYNFDRDRPVTPLPHLVRDHREGPAVSRREHYREWVRLVAHRADGEAAEQEADRLMAMRYSIHYHVWTRKNILEWVGALPDLLGIAIDVECSLFHGEQLVIIRKR